MKKKITAVNVMRTLLVALGIVLVLSLASCSQSGTLYGEFHDAELFAQSLAEKPEKKDWNNKELFEGGTGATIQAKTFGRPVGESVVLLDGKTIATADGWGQFWIDLTPGDYVLTGKCEGYKEQEISVSIESGKKTYINFILQSIEEK